MPFDLLGGVLAAGAGAADELSFLVIFSFLILHSVLIKNVQIYITSHVQVFESLMLVTPKMPIIIISNATTNFLLLFIPFCFYFQGFTFYPFIDASRQTLFYPLKRPDVRFSVVTSLLAKSSHHGHSCVFIEANYN